MQSDGFAHVPVLKAEVLGLLLPAARGGVLVDCTLGGGGHAEAFLEADSDLIVVGLDRDDEALAAVAGRLGRFSDRLRPIKSNFADIEEVLRQAGIQSVSAVLYDLGVSSHQLDRPGRGFQYRSGSPLDMRMDTSSPVRAADIVNEYSQKDLASVIARFGEERFASRVASAIVRRRAKQEFEDAGDLAEVIKEAIPAATRRTGPHPARRTFQALRIEVNQELESLERSLDDSIRLLSTGGRVAAISYHSLEDRIVKRRFQAASRGCTCPRDLPVCVCGKEAEMRVLTKKAIRPSPQESQSNPRSDSGRLRAAEKLGKAS